MKRKEEKKTVEDQARGQTRSHPSDEDDFLWETRFLKPPRYCLHFLFFLCRWILRQSKGSTISSRFTFRVDICYPPMRSVKQTTTNCFSFHFKNFPFLFSLIWIKSGASRRSLFDRERNVRNVFRLQHFFFASFCYVRAEARRGGEGTIFCPGRFTVERLISLK